MARAVGHSVAHAVSVVPASQLPGAAPPLEEVSLPPALRAPPLASGDPPAQRPPADAEGALPLPACPPEAGPLALPPEALVAPPTAAAFAPPVPHKTPSQAPGPPSGLPQAAIVRALTSQGTMRFRCMRGFMVGLPRTDRQTVRIFGEASREAVSSWKFLVLVPEHPRDSAAEMCEEVWFRVALFGVPESGIEKATRAHFPSPGDRMVRAQGAAVVARLVEG